MSLQEFKRPKRVSAVSAPVLQSVINTGHLVRAWHLRPIDRKERKNVDQIAAG